MPSGGLGTHALPTEVWLSGLSARTAWLHALSRNTEWSDYLSHEHLDLVDDKRLPGEVLRQRLMEVVRAEDLKNEGLPEAQPDVLTLGTKALQRPTA